MGKKILLADDSITIQKVIELTFSDEDFEVVTVGNGRLALERVQESPPDILLCDIIMPEKDGYDVCDFVKKNPALAHIPVLLLTGAFEPFDQERAARVGCDGFLAKPFEPQTLIAKVKDLLARNEKPAAAPAAAPPAPVAFPAPSAAVTPAVAEALPFGTPALDDEPFFSAEPEPEPEPAAEAPAPAPPASPVAVQFIPEDPFAEAAGFAPLRSEDVPAPAPVYTPPPAYTPAPPAYNPAAYAPLADPEPLKFERDAAPVADEPAPAPTPIPEPLLPDEPEELLPLTSEEAVTLGSPAAPTPVPPPSAEPLPPAWTGATVEVPLEDRAQASLEAAVPEAEPFFEEVFEEEPRAVAPPVAEPITAPDPEPEPDEPEAEAEAEALLEAEPDPEPQPAAVSEPPRAAAAPMTYDQTLVDEVSFAELREAPAVAAAPEAATASAGVAVPVDMVSQIAQRVVAQISEKVIREIAWEVIPDLAEELIKKEIERLKAELQQI